MQRAHYTDCIIQEKRLWIADPKAIHHMLQGTSYLYQKPAHFMRIVQMFLDRGVGAVEGEFTPTSHVLHLIASLGDDHKRQRRVIAPAFGLIEAKALYPCFSQCSNSVSHYVLNHECPS